MERIQTSLTGISSTRLQLGFEGEQNHTRVVIYCTQIFGEYPDAVASMVIKPPTGDIYPKVLTRDGMKVIWDASAADCAIPGNGQYQLTFTNGDEIIKTYIGEYTVLRSLIGSGDPPDPVEDWLQEAQDALAAFDQDVSDAEAWAIGTRDGEPVESTDPTYENNSKYYAEQAEEVLESIPSDYTELSEDVDALHAIKAPVIISSASGAIASFPDGADNLPVKTLNVSIEPVQDLHGQDSPYPPGGGKNKLPILISDIKQHHDTGAWSGNTYTIYGQTLEFLTDVNGYVTGIKTSGSSKPQTSFRIDLNFDGIVLPAGEYTISGKPSSNTDIGYAFQLRPVRNSGSNIVADNKNTSSDVLTFTSDGTTVLYPVLFYSSNATAEINGTWEPMIRLSSVTDPTYAPYSNLCPISGWTGANVSRTGVNVWDEEWELGGIDTGTGVPDSTTNKIRSKNLIAVKSGETYYGYLGGSGSLSARLYKPDGTYYGTGGITNTTITIPDGVAYMRIVTSTGYGTTYNHDISINYPSTDTQYHAYSGETIEYEFPSSAGTVYGGTLTIHQDGSGELVVDRAMWTKNTSTMNNGENVPGWRQAGIAELIGTGYNNVFNAAMNIGTKYNANTRNNNDILFLDTSHYGKTQTEWQALAIDVQIVVELATHVTYQLTNQQVVSLLKGTNNLWADCGSVSLEYPADTKLYIDGKLAEIQALILENISNS